MAKYIIKRILQGLLIIFIVTVLVFLLMRLLPTDSFFTEEQLMKFSPEQKEMALKAAGLTDPIPQQLLRYLGNLLRGDFGVSRRIQAGVPVMTLIGQRFGVSMKIGLIAMTLSLVIGVLMGMMQARFKNQLGDKLGTVYTVFVNAVPALVSYSLVLVIGTRVFGLPTLYSTRAHPILSSILPIICLSMVATAGYAIWTRRYMIDELNKDYIKLARMKGLSEKQIMRRHIFRNAMVPLIQYLPANFILTIGGSLLVERFFSIPGMGPLLTDAIQRYDLEVVQALVILYAALGIGGVVLGDILMAIVDPRITLDGKGGGRDE